MHVSTAYRLYLQQFALCHNTIGPDDRGYVEVLIFSIESLKVFKDNTICE